MMRFFLFVRLAILRIQKEKWKSKAEIYKQHADRLLEERNEVLRQHYETLRRLLK